MKLLEFNEVTIWIMGKEVSDIIFLIVLGWMFHWCTSFDEASVPLV